ncbi:transcriptional regulator, AraC family [Streptomyces sp. 3214.6]|nr:transcriptional regulator, AraC family [Streptomyces sp. 3214.6]
MSVVVPTVPFSPSERADYWHSLVSNTFIPLDVTLHERERSVGTISSARLGPLRISVVGAGPQTVSRHRRLIAQGGEEYLTVTLQQRGTARLSQDGRQVVAKPGTFTCTDTGRPFTREHPDDFRFTWFGVPKKELGMSDTELRTITGTLFSGSSGTSGLVAGYLARLADHAAAFDSSTGRRLAMTAVDLLTVMVRERQGRLDPQASDTARGMLARVKAYILRNLADSELSPERIAVAHHISVRYLHNLFRSEGITVGRWIHRERLERCRGDLSRPSGTAPTVSAVAQRWGFVSASHFSRVFRTAYGMSPREWQASTRHT